MRGWVRLVKGFNSWGCLVRGWVSCLHTITLVCVYVYIKFVTGPSITIHHHPSPSITIHQHPSPSIIIHHRLSPSITIHHLSPSITVHHYSSLFITVHHHPLPSITVYHDPSLSITIHQSEGQTQKEAMYINKSLTFLEQVSMREMQRSHLPVSMSYPTSCTGCYCTSRQEEGPCSLPPEQTDPHVKGFIGRWLPHSPDS